MHCIKKQLLKGLLIVGALLLFSQFSTAQVTIGSVLTPNKDALLDLQEEGTTTKGLLLPRVALQQTTSFAPMQAHTQGMVVYNTAKVADVTPGYYYNNGTKWMKLYTVSDSFFYMPSTVLPTDENDPAFAGGVFSINLYDNYQKQFALSGANTASSSAQGQLPVYGSSDLHYFVTYFDDTVFTDVAVNASGILTYKLKSGFTYSEKTFMNIILKVK